ncbi:hydroxyacid dehydrogenase [Humitalea sp. 24SJ18S-53]|uniref:hydroxyacid dehydrogenase n=1 Tax=Humitalea sp. 24SJ18S-53 TaxID=3422307 RepID=UPI003D665B6E
MRRVLIPDAIHPDGIALLRDHGGFDVLTQEALADPAARTAALAGAEAMIVRGMPVNQALLDNAPLLRFVCRHGVGYDTVDVPALLAHGGTLAITPEANALSVAEHALMLMLTLARRLVDYNAGLRRGEWRVQSDSPTFDLAGRTVLLIGFGRIGTRVAKLCAAFGLRVLVHDPAIPANTIRGLGFVPAPDRAAAMAEADIVSLHLPSNKHTRGLVDAGFLAAMKPGSVLINTARGTLVDEAALEAALRSGHIAAAGIDVIHTEPMTTPIPLLSLPNVVATPHVAASTAQSLRRMSLSAATNVIDYFNGCLDPDSVILE